MPCDISKFKDSLSYKKDILTNLAYVNLVSSREDRSKEDHADIDVMDYDTFTSKLASSLETLLDLKWTQRDQEWLLTSSLSNEGAQAYIECVRSLNTNLIVTLSDSATNSDEFIVEYTWRPNYPAQPQAIFQTVFVNATSDDVPKSIQTPSSGAFKVKRLSMYKPLELSVHVDGQAYPPITLPAFPTKKIQKEIRKASLTLSVDGGNSSVVKNICVTLGNNEQDTVIVPGSANVKLDQTIGLRAHMGVGALTSNDREACASVVWDLEAGDGHVAGTATVSVLVLKAVPVTNVAEADIPVAELVGETVMFKGQA